MDTYDAGYAPAPSLTSSSRDEAIRGAVDSYRRRSPGKRPSIPLSSFRDLDIPGNASRFPYSKSLTGFARAQVQADSFRYLRSASTRRPREISLAAKH
jgi:hypothetical protein